MKVENEWGGDGERKAEASWSREIISMNMYKNFLNQRLGVIIIILQSINVLSNEKYVDVLKYWPH